MPPAKRGRVLVSWQVFTATGIFIGSIATYIFKGAWRNQVLSGAIPAFILLILAYLSCESPRWLVLSENYLKAFDTLVKLRKERVLAAEEIVYIHFQIQAERALLRGNRRPDFRHHESRIGYSERLPKLVTLARNRRAAVSSMIVMVSQQLSGINILAFLASIFFSAAGFSSNSDPITSRNNSLGLTIGFGGLNALFSVVAYWFIEPLPVDYALDENFDDILPENRSPAAPNDKKSMKKKRRSKFFRLLNGRRSLLILSLGGGTVMLFMLSFVLAFVDEGNPAKLPVVFVLIALFTFTYSPGAGCVPFLYSAEVWPNEGRGAFFMLLALIALLILSL